MIPGIFFDNLASAYPDFQDSAFLVEKAAEIGYKYLEMDIEKLKKQDKKFFETAEKYSVGFSVYCFSDENCILKDGTASEDNLEFLASHNVNSMMMVCSSHEKADKYDNNIFERICFGLNRLCSSAKKYGITVLVEDFDSLTIPCGNCDDMLKLAEKVPEIMFTLDTGNFAFFGENVLSCYDRIRERTSHIHLKDRVSENDLKVPVTGRGGLPLSEVLHRLKADGYDRKISIEMFGAECTCDTLAEALGFLNNNYI